MGYLRLKVEELLREAGTNLHQAHLEAGFSYPTMHRYQKYPDQIASLHTPSIVSFLVRALHWTPAEIEATPLGHFFEVVEDGEREPLDALAFTAWMLEQQLAPITKIDDPVMNGLTDEALDRVKYLMAEREPGKNARASWREYAICMMRNRVQFWARLAPDLMVEDPELLALSQAIMSRLDELARE